MAGTTGELMGDLVVELGGGEVETLTGVVGAAVGVRGRAEGVSWTGTGDRHSGLLATGDGEGVVFSGLVSSGKNGSGKKEVPGVFRRVIWRGKQRRSGRSGISITLFQREKFGGISPVFQALETV